MKKIIIIILLISISIFSFSILFNSEKQKADSNMEKAEEKLNNTYKILLPDDVINKNQDIIYNKMIETLKKHKANIYYSRVGNDDRTLKFVYLSDLNYLDNFTITKGRRFNINENESDKFLSSFDTKKKNQIGQIGTFDGKKNIEIHTLKSMITNNNYKLNGICLVQLPPNDNINFFIDDLENNLGINSIQKSEFGSVTLKSSDYNKWILPSLYFVIALLILYDIIKSYKKYGVQLMLGYSDIRIWLSEVIRLAAIQLIIFIIVNIIMGMYLFKGFNLYTERFLKLLIIDNIEKLIVLFIVSSVPFIYLNNIKISNMLKNNLPIKHIIIFNSLVKIVILVLMFNILNQGFQNYRKISNVFTNKYKSWEETEGYYILPSMNVKNGSVDVPEFAQMQIPLYHLLNKEGAIMANFYSYSPIKRKYLVSETKNYYESDQVKINPNYLKANIVYDVNGKPISVSEAEKDEILLVPQKYKKDESIIRNYYKDIYKTRGLAEKKVKIIYIKSNQKLFTYELDVNPNEGNFIKNPIISVITDNNGDKWDYGVVIGTMGSPIKIKANSTNDPIGYIKGKLKETNLDKYVDEFTPVNQAVAFECKSVYNLMKFIIGAIIILLILILLIIVQNTYCYFEQFKKHIAIRQFNGYNTIDKYKEYFLLIIVSWIVIFLATHFIVNMKIIIQTILTLIIMMFEIFVTLIVIKLVHKRKISDVIKGS